MTQRTRAARQRSLMPCDLPRREGAIGTHEQRRIEGERDPKERDRLLVLGRDAGRALPDLG